MRLLRNSLLAVLILIAGLVTTLLVLDLGFLRPALERVASHLLEREVRIAGELHIDVGKALRLSATEFEIAASEPGAAAFVSARAVEASLDLPALFDGILAFHAAKLEGVELRVATDDRGLGNWPLASSDPDEPPIEVWDYLEAFPFAVVIADLRASELSMILRDGELDRDYALQIDALTEQMSNDDVSIIAGGALNQIPFSLELSSRDMASLLQRYDWSIDLIGQLGDVAVEGSAHIDQIDRIARSNSRLHVSAPSMTQLIQALDLPEVVNGPLDITLDIDQREKTVSLEGTVLMGQFSASASAQTDDSLTFDSASITVAAEGPNLAHLGLLVGQRELPDTPFEIELVANRSGYSLQIESLRLLSEALNLGLEGEFLDFRQPDTGYLEGAMEMPSLALLTPLLDLPAELAGSLAISAAIGIQRGEQGASVLIRTSNPYLDLEIQGEVSRGERLINSPLSIRGKSDNPSGLLRLIHEELADMPELTFEGLVALDGADLLSIEHISGQLGVDTFTAQGIVGWADSVSATQLDIAIDSADLRNTLGPWLGLSHPVTALPGRISGRFTYPSESLWRFDDGVLSSVGGGGSFSLAIRSTEADALSVAADVNLVWPSIAPMLQAVDLPAHYDRPASLSVSIAWEEQSAAFDNLKLIHGDSSIEGGFKISPERGIAEFDLSGRTPNALVYSDEMAADAITLPLEIVARGALNDTVWSIDQFNLESVDAHASVSGYLEQAGSAFSRSHLSASIQIAHLDDFSELLNIALPDEDLALSLKLETEEQKLFMESLSLKSGTSTLTASGSIENPSEPEFALTIESPLIDLTPWLADAEDDELAADAPETASPQTSDRLIPDIPLDALRVQGFTGEAQISIDVLQGFWHPLSDVSVDISHLNSGTEVKRLRFTTPAGGSLQLEGGITFDEGGVADTTLFANGSQLVIGIPKAPGRDIASLPKYDMRTRLHSTGSTSRDLAANLGGYFYLAMGEGRIENTGYGHLTNSFFQELTELLNPFRKDEDSTKINCAAVFSTVEFGRVSGKPSVVVDTPKLKIFADSKINLGTEKLEATFKTVPQKGLGLSMSSLVNPFIGVSGTLGNPTISLNPAGTVVEGSMAVITGGLSMLARSTYNRLSSMGNVCAKQIGKANEMMDQAESASPSG